MSGPAWRLWFLLLLAVITIVIANHHRQHDNSVLHSYHKLQKLADNETNAQDEISLQLPPIRVPHLRHHHVTHWGPYFENSEGQGVSGPQHVALHLGATAMLDCRVAMLADKTVVWMRRSTERVSLLTVGKTTYSSDPRYSLTFQYPNNWRLAISSVRRDDYGLYVCQVSTHPPRMLTINVTVLAPEIKIVDEAGHEVQDRYYKTGSSVELTCIVRPSRLGARVPHPLWTKNDEKLPKHVNIHRINGSDEELVTRIHIDRAEKADGGEYTCSMGVHSTSMVHLHVLNGEKQAAVHHDQWNAGKMTQHENRNIAFTALALLFLQASITRSL